MWDSYPDLDLEDINSKPNVGIAFSGGGPVAASITLGQTRALDHLGILDKVRYVSCVSASTWTLVPFMFLPETYSEKDFLGEIVAPQDISLEHLDKVAPESHASTIAGASVVGKYIKNVFKFSGDETYSRSIGDIFLKPYDLHSQKKFFTLDENSRTEILKLNPHMEEKDFYTTRKDRPFFIVGGSIMQLNNKHPLPIKMHFEMTPLHLGAPILNESAGKNGDDIGGSFMESFAFDSKLVALSNDKATVRLGSKEFTLSDMMGTSSSAPAETLDKFNMDWLGFPEFRYWDKNHQGKNQKSDSRTHEYNFGDGGFMENMGVMPLLARKVKKILVCVNVGDTITKKSINWSLPALFGFGVTQINTVFEKNKFVELVEELLNNKANGESLIHRDKYQILENPHYGVEGGWETEITWIYNENVPKWKDKLRPEVLERFEGRALRNFPHYRLFFQNRDALIKLSPEQVFLVSNLAEWNILDNSELITELLT